MKGKLSFSALLLLPLLMLEATMAAFLFPPVVISSVGCPRTKVVALVAPLDLNSHFYRY
jgi:hypothetical protein